VTDPKAPPPLGQDTNSVFLRGRTSASILNKRWSPRHRFAGTNSGRPASEIATKEAVTTSRVMTADHVRGCERLHGRGRGVTLGPDLREHTRICAVSSREFELICRDAGT
jgi:hypothetical protein